MSSSQFEETADIETAGDDYARRFSGSAGRYFLETQTRITLDLLADLQGGTVLDVGGGHAQTTVPLVGAGFDVTVTGSAESCRRRLDLLLEPGSFTYRTCDCLKLPFEDKRFDAVISFRLLPHTRHWKNLVNEMCRVARVCVLFDYPDIRSSNILYNRLFKLKKSMEKNTRTYTLFNRGQIQSALKENGFIRPRFQPQFFFPMVMHRKINNREISRGLEAPFRLSGMTRLLGSPIIVRADRLEQETSG